MRRLVQAALVPLLLSVGLATAIPATAEETVVTEI
jgi:hypothetical protein